MLVTIELYRNFGHPDNRPTAESVLKMLAEELPKAIAASDSKLKSWGVSAIKVE